MYGIIDALKIEISNHGMTPPEHIEPGKMTRFSDDGGKNKNGWCTLFVNPDGSAGGAFGNWKDVEKKWFYNPNGKALTGKQQQDLTKQIAQAQEKAELEQKAKQAQAAKKATGIWNNAGPVDSKHGYLVKKQINPYGLKQSGKVLIVPVLNFRGAILSLQQIEPDGQKKFFPGGQVKGGSFVIGDIKKTDSFYICEGYATGATIHKATNKPVIIAFNSGNLKTIAQLFKTEYPSKKIIIAGDNDIETEKEIETNPGRKAGKEAAQAIGAELILCPVNSDFNDLMQAQGIDAVKKVLRVKKRQFQLKRLSEIQFKAPDYLIESYFEKDTLTMSFGDPGATKTFFAVDMGCCIASGKDFHGFDVKQGPVVYIAGEGQSGLKRRFMAWGIRHGYNVDDLDIFLSLMPAGLCDQDQAKWVVDEIKQIQKECGEPVLIVFDTVARNFGPGDENSTKDMNAFILGADMIREQCKACILLIHHTGHGDKSRGRGAMSLKGALDAEYRLEKDDIGIIRVTNTKMKDSAPPEPMAFKIVTVELPFKDKDGKQITSAVLESIDYEEPAKKSNIGRGKWQAVAIKAYDSLTSEQQGRLEGKGYAPEGARVLVTDWRNKCFDDGMSKQTFGNCKTSLIQQGIFRIDHGYVVKNL